MSSKRDPDRSALALFADELRAAREQAGLSRDELAGQLNYSASLVAMVEGLHRVPQADFAARCDVVLGTSGTFARLQKRLRVLPFAASFRPFAAYEEAATSLRSFEHSHVPGLLQTAQYARAVLGIRANIPLDGLDDLVASRLARQGILDRDNPPMLWVVIDEAVLHREVGGPKVMREQLLHLAAMSGQAEHRAPGHPVQRGRACRAGRRVRDRRLRGCAAGGIPGHRGRRADDRGAVDGGEDRVQASIGSGQRPCHVRHPGT